MIDTVRMESLLRIARNIGVARVALVGDTAQLRAVDAGQPFRLLQKAGMATAVMDEVLRQRDPELLEAVGHARAGQPGAAIAGLGRRVHEFAREEFGAEAGRRWIGLAPEDRADTAILAPTHAIRRQVNETVREGLEAEGVLHGQALAIDRLVNRRLTCAQASDIRSYEPGDTVVLHRDVYGCRANDVCMVTGPDEGQVVLAGPDGGERRFRPSGNAAGNLGLYDTERIELRAGERIRWTRNHKAPRPRFGHPAQPDLVNGGEAEILEIDRKRVRFRDEGGREFGFALKDPQLRHLDHAYCSTVHAAQGRTARGVIAVLDACGAMDQAMFHVEVSRASEAFLLLTDDREALVEMLEARRPDREDGALEALGLDPATPPVVEPELFETLVADWRALQGPSDETGALPFFRPGYEAVMARAAALSVIEDLPADMRGFVDGMLAEHERHLAHDREVRNLAERIREQWRRWSELRWAASGRGCAPEDLPERAAWREEGTVLLEAARSGLADAMPGSGLAGAVEDLERVRLLDDARRFERGWQALRERAAREDVPELHADCYAEVAERGAALLEADGLDPLRRRVVLEWRRVHDEQTSMADVVRILPDRTSAWRERRAVDLPLDEHSGADPLDPACHAWREEGQALLDEADGMLEKGSLPAIHMDAMPGSRAAVIKVLAAVDDALLEDRYRQFAWLTRHVARQSTETRTESFHVPRYREAIAHADMLSGEEALPETRSRQVDRWLAYHERATGLCDRIREWPERADALLGEWTGPERDLRPMRNWRARAEPLLAEVRAMQVEGSPHAPHLAAMPDERKALVETADWLDTALIEVEAGEMDRLSALAEEAAKQRGGIAFDTPHHAELMERVRSLGARLDLPDDARETVRDHLERHQCWTGDRAHVERFLDRAAKVLDVGDRMVQTARTGSPAEQQSAWEGWRRDAGSLLDEAKGLQEAIPKPDLTAHLGAAGAGPNAIEENAAKLGNRIRDDVEAQAFAAERERQARIAAEHLRATQEAERQRLEEERSQSRGISW